jgi:phosphoglycerate kinase
MIRSIRDIKIFENIPILVRASLNVPIENGVVMNDYRLRRAMPTIRYLSERGARVVLIGHLGEKGTETLSPVAKTLGNLIRGVSFFDGTIGVRAREAVRNITSGNILVMENLRRNGGEISNDRAFARELAALGDIFVQDCFDTSHRPHASIIGVPEILSSYAGFLLEEEISELSRALKPKKPSLAVIGGVKFSTKESVLSALLKTYDHVFVGGALANDFIRASGREVGKSIVSGANTSYIKKLLLNIRLVFPEDSVVVPFTSGGLKNNAGHSHIASTDEISVDEVIVDQGPVTTKLLIELAKEAETVLWNGPLGKYEDGFTSATNSFARSVAASNAYSTIGGGDTIAAVEDLGLLSQFSFISTGGGAMLDFLAKGTLPGIGAINR